MNLKNKNIIYITHRYNSFQKDPIEIMAQQFKNVYVFVRYKPIAEISKILPINTLKTHRKDYAIDLKGKPENVHVYPTPLWYLPTEKGYKNLGEQHYKKVDKQIQDLDIEFDIIHCHFTWSAGYVGMRLKEKYNKPLVITGHGYDVYSLPFKDEEWRGKITEVLNSADYITTVSNSNLKELEKLNIKTPIQVIPNGFNSDLFYPRDQKECKKKLNIPLDKKVLLSVGNLVKIKGHKFLIEAMPKILDQYPNTILYIVGGGSLKGNLEKLVDESDLKSNVYLVGAKPHEEIPIWMNAADLFVLPSIRESFGVVQLEAMACGKPIVATKNGGSEEIICKQNNGLLADAKDSKALVNNVLQALEKKWNSNNIIESVGGFKNYYIANKLENVYVKVINNY